MSTFETTLTNDEAFDKTAPEAIWLVIGDEGTYAEAFNGDVCWSVDKEYDCDVKYIRYDLAKAATAERDKLVRKLQAQNSELSASINVLREDLEKLARLGNEPYYGNSIGNDIARQALASTPAQSLQEHDNKLLNKLRVRNWTDAMNIAWHKAIPDVHKAFDDLIEALKGK